MQCCFLPNAYFNYGHIYLTVNAFLLIIFFALYQKKNINFNSICLGIQLLVFFEAIVCFLQYFGIYESKGEFFLVTGSLINPNITAMFFTMALPFVLYHVKHKRQAVRIFSWIALTLLFLSLLMLKCRTAIIGVAVIAVYLANKKFEILKRLIAYFQKPSKINLIVASMLPLLVLITLSFSLYNYKKESADSRFTIWKISLQKGMENPIWGYGVHSFVKEYNLAQASFFASGQGTDEEKQSCSHIKIAYNDYIQNFVEGGGLGVFLYVCFLMLLVIPGLSRKNNSPEFHLAYSGVLAYGVMSMLNSAQYAIPVFALFIFCAAVVSSYYIEDSKYSDASFILNQASIKAILLMITVASIYLLNTLFTSSNASLQIKEAFDYVNQAKYKEAISKLEDISIDMSFTEEYWWVYGSALQGQREYGKALEKHKKMLSLTTDPNIFMKVTNCYANLGKTEEAIQSCTQAMDMIPNRLYPKYILMKLYQVKGDSLRSIRIAQDILTAVPKGISKDAAAFKEGAQELIEYYKK